MHTRRLPEAAFKATFAGRMRAITGGDHEAIDIGAYVATIPPEDLDGLRRLTDPGEHVWRDPYDRWDHVLLPLTQDNTYLVIVVDLRNRSVHGHHVLDLGALCGRSREGE